jgi:nucleoside-diphosphate-sugar epimerase
MADTPLDRWSPPRTTALTGASGWLGRALVHRLVADPRRPQLRLLVHSTADAHALTDATRARPGVEIIIGDISKADTARRLLHGVDADTDVIHTAGVIHPSNVRQFTEVNTNGTRHVADAALDAGVRRLVHVSSNSPFGTNPHAADTFGADEPFNPYLGYGTSKMFAEMAVNEAVAAGLDATTVRPPWFYGPFQPPRQTTFFKMVRAGKFPVIGHGDQRRSMVYVENLVDGILAAELSPIAKGRGYWIADARAYTVAEIVETVGRALTDEGLSVRPPSTSLPAVASRIAEAIDRLLQSVGLYQQQLHVLGEMGHTIACDISKATAELGYTPAIDLYEGMRRSIRWCLDQGLEL